MSKLSELQAIRDRLKEELGSNDLAVKEIARLLSVSPATVYGYLSKSQNKPIPDKSLKLLKLLTSSS